MGDVLIVKIQEVGRPVIGFKNGQILCAQVGVFGLSSMEREKKGEVRIVRIKEPGGSEIVDAVSGKYRQPGIEQVIAFFQELGAMGGKYLETLGDRAFERRAVLVIKDH